MQRRFLPYRQTLAFWVACTLAVTVAYSPGLNGPFIADDYPNFIFNDLVRVDALTGEKLYWSLTSNRSGPLHRPLPALSFGLNYFFADGTFDRFHFKVTNLVIHLLTAFVAFALVRLLVRHKGGALSPNATLIAAVAVGIWAVHPLQLTNVLYVVQRMNAMAGLAVIFGLWVYCQGRARLAQGQPGAWSRMIGGLIVGTALGLACKENAILLPAFALVIEVTLFRWTTTTAANAKRLKLLHLAGSGLTYVGGALVAWWVLDFWSATYAALDYSAFERVLTQPRILAEYLRMLLVPDLTSMNFFHDDVKASRGLLTPWTTAVTLSFWLAVCALAYAWRHTNYWFTFGVAWFLAGHALEASVVPLELMYEHRNYTPSLGLILGVTMVFARFILRVSQPRLAISVAVIAVVALTSLTFVRASLWQDSETLARTMIERNPNSLRAWMAYAVLLEYQSTEVTDIYPVAHRAALIAPLDISSRVKMMKYISYMALTLERHGLREQPPIKDERGEVLLRINTPALLTRRDDLGAAVAEILAQGYRAERVTPAKVLTDLTDCITTKRPECLALIPYMEQWLDILVNNTKLRPATRQRIYAWMQARVAIAQGEISRALAIINDAIALDPSDVSSHQRLAFLLMASGKFEQADAKLAELETMARTSRDRSALAKLKRELERRRAG